MQERILQQDYRPTSRSLLMIGICKRYYCYLDFIKSLCSSHPLLPQCDWSGFPSLLIANVFFQVTINKVIHMGTKAHGSYTLMALIRALRSVVALTILINKSYSAQVEYLRDSVGPMII
jgi:hypothetical protein